MINRKPGQRKADLSDEKTSKVLKTAKTLIRTDFGGSSDPLAVIKKKALEAGIDAGPQSLAFIKKMLEDQVESCRKRVFPRLDEAIRRSELLEGSGGTAPERMP